MSRPNHTTCPNLNPEQDVENSSGHGFARDKHSAKSENFLQASKTSLGFCERSCEKENSRIEIRAGLNPDIHRAFTCHGFYFSNKLICRGDRHLSARGYLNRLFFRSLKIYIYGG